MEGSSFLNCALLNETALSITVNEAVSARPCCMLFWTLAYAAQIVPPKHLLADTYLDLEKSAEQWKRCALQVGGTIQPSSDAKDMLTDICILIMEALWYAKSGNMHKKWLLTGMAIRQGAFLHLFDPVGAARNSPDDEVHRSRAFVVAHQLLLLDRWSAFNSRYPLGIARADLDLTRCPFAQQLIVDSQGRPMHQSAAEKHSLRVSLEQKQTIMLEMGAHLRRSCDYSHGSKGELRQRVASFLAEVDTLRYHGTQEISRQLGMTLADDMTSESILQHLPLKQAFQVAEWRGACAYIACETASWFIHDQGASGRIRHASMQSACEMLKVAEIL
jgi:hypothetical protein